MISIRLYSDVMKVCSLTCLLHLFPNEIVIYDTGKAVRVVKYDTINSLKISDLTAGIYFIKFKVMLKL
jgi:hypothetical protein